MNQRDSIEAYTDQLIALLKESEIEMVTTVQVANPNGRVFEPSDGPIVIDYMNILSCDLVVKP